MSKLLICIDDDEEDLELFTDALKEIESTITCITASTGMQGLDQVRAIIPDCIFLDINMPDMDGWEFLDEYKQLKKDQHGKVIIIMLTTSLNPDDSIKAGKIPEISGFAIKPLTAELIDKVLKEHFDW